VIGEEYATPPDLLENRTYVSGIYAVQMFTLRLQQGEEVMAVSGLRLFDHSRVLIKFTERQLTQEFVHCVTSIAAATQQRLVSQPS
jgi:hypothetical protein